MQRVGVCGTDTHAIEGTQPYFEYPRVLGHELAGNIQRCGSEVSGWSEGQRVAIRPYVECGICAPCRAGRPNCCVQLQVLGVHIDGGMAEALAVPETHLVPVDGLTLDEAVSLEFLSVSWHAIVRAGVNRREWAMVIGCGPIGVAALKFLKLAQSRTIAVDTDTKRLAFAQSWAGCDEVLLGGDAMGLDHKVQELTKGDRPSLVIDATGNAGSMSDAVQYVGHGGRIVFVGLAQALVSFWDPLFHQREMTILSSRNSIQSDFLSVRELIQKGSVDVRPIITHNKKK